MKTPRDPNDPEQQELYFAPIPGLDDFLFTINKRRLKLLKRAHHFKNVFIAKRDQLIKDHAKAQPDATQTLFARLTPKLTKIDESPLPESLTLSIGWNRVIAPNPRAEPNAKFHHRFFIRNVSRGGRKGKKKQAPVFFSPAVLHRYALDLEWDLLWETEEEFARIRREWAPLGRAAKVLKNIKAKIATSREHGEAALKIARAEAEALRSGERRQPARPPQPRPTA